MNISFLLFSLFFPRFSLALHRALKIGPNPLQRGIVGQGPCITSKGGTQSRIGGDDWLYRNLAEDSAFAARADLCAAGKVLVTRNGTVTALVASPKDRQFASGAQFSWLFSGGTYILYCGSDFERFGALGHLPRQLPPCENAPGVLLDAGGGFHDREAVVQASQRYSITASWARVAVP